MLRLLVLLFSGLSVCLCVIILREYHYVNSSKTWAEAQQYCRNTFNDLATVDNQDDSNKLHSVLPDSGQRAWIGLRDDVIRWKWSKGNKAYNNNVDYNNWKESDPDNKMSSEGCVAMTYNGYWRDFNCSSTRHVACLDEQGGSRFVIVKTKMTWEKAKDYCRSNYTDLAVVQNKSENEEIKKLVRSQHWIGLHRKLWSAWSDQTPTTFTNWATHQPDNNANTVASCAAVIAKSGAWLDDDCQDQHHFICQNVFYPPVRKQTTFRLKFKFDAGIAQRVWEEQILKQLQEILEMNGESNVTLRWNKGEGNVFRRQRKEKEWGC